MYIFIPENLLDCQRQRYKWSKMTPGDHFKIKLFFLWENIIFRFNKASLMLHLMNKTFLVGRLWSPESRLSGNYQKIFLSVLSFCFFLFFDLRSKSSTSINLICIENTEIDCPRRVKPISFFIWPPSEPKNGNFLVENYERELENRF